MYVLLFTCFSSALKFHCTFEIRTWNDLGEIYICSATSEVTATTTSSISLEEVVGNHLSGKSNEDVKGVVTYRSSEFTQIPLGMETFFPDLKLIQFWYGNISSVVAEHLRPFPNLVYLSLPVNHITSLDTDLFKYTTKIKDFVIPSNKIQRVGENIFSNLPELRWVNFLSNPCFSYYADTPEQLQYLKNSLAQYCPSSSSSTSTATSSLPPSTTTTIPATTPGETDTCDLPVRCSLNEEVEEMRVKLILQRNLIDDHENVISLLSARTSELEKQILEINAKP